MNDYVKETFLRRKEGPDPRWSVIDIPSITDFTKALGRTPSPHQEQLVAALEENAKKKTPVRTIITGGRNQGKLYRQRQLAEAALAAGFTIIQPDPKSDGVIITKQGEELP